MRSRSTRTLPVDPARVWKVVGDPRQMPNWWPGVDRVEGVTRDRFTQVFTTKRGRPVRVDQRLLRSEPQRARAWEQEIEATPFERVLNASVTEVRLEPATAGTRVTIEQRQQLRGYSRTGALLLRRATAKRLREALVRLEQIC